MKLETKTKTIEYEVYIAEDGKEFESEGECKLYEKKLAGDVKDCPDCNGRGWILIDILNEDYHTGAQIINHDSKICKTCMGKGYLVKKIKEVWE